MLSIEQQAQQQWLIEQTKKLLEKVGLPVDTTLLDEAKVEQEKIDVQVALIEEVIEAQQAVADKYNPLLKETRDNMDACCKLADHARERYTECINNKDIKGSEKHRAEELKYREWQAIHFENVKDIIETMTVEAKQAEENVLADNITKEGLEK